MSQLKRSELKTEGGYSAAIVRSYIPGDICPHNVRTMSNNVRTMSAQHFPRETYILREILCGHSADIVRTYISKDICPNYILRFSAQVTNKKKKEDSLNLLLWRNEREKEGMDGGEKKEKLV